MIISKNKTKIKKGDTVFVLAGKDKKKRGKVSRVLSKEDKLVVEGINLVVKHMRPRKGGEKGQKMKIAKPMDVSNVMIVCPKCGKIARIGSKILEDGTKVRICKKCSQEI